MISPLMKINVSIQETKIAYRCVTWYAVFTRVKYTTTPRNYQTLYPSRSSKGWEKFWPEPMKILIDMLNHAHWLRISYIEGLHDAVRIHTRTILSRSLVSFLYVVVWGKTTKPAVTFDLLIVRFEILTACVFQYSCHSVVIWYCNMN